MTGNSETLADWLRLTLIPGIGGQTQRKLLAAFGLPDAIFSAGYASLRAVIGDKAAALLQGGADEAAVDMAIAWTAGVNQRIVTLADAAYPQALLDTADPPTVLYVRGRLELLNRPALAIVGSRNPTPQGVLNAEQFAAALSAAGFVIVSGLAIGIDAAAHRGALQVGGETVAFIGTGIDRIYPARNRDLAHQIGERGVIVSEFPLGTPVLAANFPRRNRLISGIARGTLVVEAATESGSLITARLAGEQGREVFAIPGSIHSPLSKGCHRLIKQGAKLVETAQDILEELNWTTVAAAMSTETASGDDDPANGHDEVTGKLLSLMGHDPITLDELAMRAALDGGAVSVALLQLELDGQVAVLPGSRYQRLFTH